MTVINEIKELEKQAKRSEHYQELYNGLYNDVTKISNELGELQVKLSLLLGKMISKTPSKKASSYAAGKISDSLRSVAEGLYADIKTDDGNQITTATIENSLLKNGIGANDPNIVAVRNYLRTLENVHVRKDGRCIILYYHAPSENNDETSELVKTLPKKVSYGV